MRALVCRGWGARAISDAQGIPEADTARMLTGELARVTPGMAAAAAAAYERLWDRQPPERTRAERQRARAARERARRNGWAPPMAWDDDDLDDEAGGPALDWKRRERGNVRLADLLEDVAFLRESDGYRQATPAQLAIRLGLGKGAVERALQRGQQAARREAG